ncbi:DNA/RNA non-specific endonuclease [Sediminitomix flava]|uniref:Endonuclease n=1 Tax=Sediminitomix flava TaxID=379075 RepID=A0A315YWQ7_SEDFL|nr:DNA/RNA non-specific endonuclease [Sediminitomix flava]PWJ34204.1 endonuclease G [Sediminitomix flava]
MRKYISIVFCYSLLTLFACVQKQDKTQTIDIDQLSDSELTPLQQKAPAKEKEITPVKKASVGGKDFQHDVDALLPKSEGQVIKHSYYTLSYSEKHEQAEWVAYELVEEELVKNSKRSDNFRPDPSITSESAQLADYKGSGYDRGHLAPAADMSFNKKAMSESFFLSNMSPQHPDLNRRAWKELESIFRDWARSRGEIMIYTGPVLEDGLPTIGASKVSVPKWYYKIGVDLESNDAIAFLMPNGKCDKPLSSYAVPIQKVEDMTGIDFMPKLDDAIEEELEALLDVQDWFVNSSETKSKKKSSKNSK